MEPFSLQWAADKLKVRPIGDASGVVQHVCIDSRQVQPGSLFFALPGERVDGHRFVAQAFERGAVGAVVSEELEGLSGTLLRVPDTTRALGDLAMHYRGKFRIPVVGITGSVGKTSTKEMTATALRAHYRVLANEKNYNNEFGVPLTLFGLDKTHEVAVIEMGMRGLGQIDRLAEIARPRIGVITNIGYAHIELLGSQQNIAQAKSELLARLPKNGIAIMPTDPGSQFGRRTTPTHMPHLRWLDPAVPQDELFDYLRSRIPAGCRVITFGHVIYHRADVSLWPFEDMPGGGVKGLAVVRGKECPFVLPVPGHHNLVNAEAALAVAIALKVGLEIALDALKDWQGAEGRMVIRHTTDGVIVLDDCYNASPESVEAALTTLGQFKVDNPNRVAVLGDMRELGDFAAQAHQLVGIKVAETEIRELVTVGPLAEGIAESLKKTCAAARRHPPVCTHYADTAEAAQHIRERIRPGDAVLVKGARAMEMERIVAALTGEAEAKAHG